MMLIKIDRFSCGFIVRCCAYLLSFEISAASSNGLCDVSNVFRVCVYSDIGNLVGCGWGSCGGWRGPKFIILECVPSLKKMFFHV